MKKNVITASLLKGVAVVSLALGLLPAAQAADLEKIKLAVFPSVTALPYYIAQSHGLFKEAGLEVEEVPVTSHPLTVQAIVSGSIDGAANLVTLEGANIESRRADTLRYISLNGQNEEFRVEQFVARSGSGIEKLTDIKGGLKLFSAPGPANIGSAREVLKKAGLKEGEDFTIQEQAVGMHLSVLQAGTFDGGYTLEPAATMMVSQNVATRVEAGVIATYLLDNKEGNAFATGTALSSRFMSERPEVAKRFAEVWAKAIAIAETDENTRTDLAAGMRIPMELASAVPLSNMIMVADLNADNLSDFQKFISLGQRLGVLRDTMDAQSLLHAY